MLFLKGLAVLEHNESIFHVDSFADIYSQLEHNRIQKIARKYIFFCCLNSVLSFYLQQHDFPKLVGIYTFTEKSIV